MKIVYFFLGSERISTLYDLCIVCIVMIGSEIWRDGFFGLPVGPSLGDGFQ
jgi:hypothetical protein